MLSWHSMVIVRCHFVMQADKLEKLRERMIKVRELFRDTEATEFVIVTIPTVMTSENCDFYLTLVIYCRWMHSLFLFQWNVQVNLVANSTSKRFFNTRYNCDLKC